MRIRIEHNGKSFEYERTPMKEERFFALCKLVGLAIGGIVLLGLTQLVGTWAVGGAVAAYVLTGVYRLMKDDF